MCPLPNQAGASANKRQQVLGPDGYHWSPETEAKLNALALRVFSSGDGYELLNYLKNITLNRALPPDATDAHLRHLEGARWLVALIEQRKAKAQGSDHASVDVQPSS